MCRKDLAQDYSELRSINADGLILIVKDAIIPNVVINVII